MNRRKLSIVVLTVLLGAFAFSEVATSAEVDNALENLRKTSKAFSKVARQAVPAVVSIQVEKTIATGSSRYSSPFGDEFFEYFFGPQYRRRAPRKQIGQGSGFIVSSDGYILTNNHVVGEADKITVTLSDGRKFEDAKVVGSDPDSEVAVIKIDAEDLPVIELGDSADLGIGEWVIAVGNPFGLTETVTVGVVSAKGRSGFNVTKYESFIQTDAAINLGNSGGPLLSLDGKAIGINTFLISQSGGGYMGIGFAIPIDVAKNIKDQFITSGKIMRGYLGVAIQRIMPDMVEFFGLKNDRGALITEVKKDSPAEKAGLKKEDVVIKMGGNKIDDAASFSDIIALTAPGTKMELVIVRNGKEKVINVTIGTWPESSDIAGKIGLQVQDLTRELAQRFGYEPLEGVIVTEVTDGGPADRAGIRPEMVILSVNRKYVNSVEQFIQALENSAETKKALLLVRTDYHIAQYVVLSFD